MIGLFLTALAVGARAAPAHADFESGWQAYKAGDLSAAVEVWTEAGEAGDARAQYNLGVLHDRGLGVERNLQSALKWWRRAALQEHRSAQHNIALTLIERGAAADLSEAVGWLEKAASAGFVRSQYSLGKMYETGFGVAADENRAFHLISQAAEGGLVSAQYSLGKIYRDGRGAEADPVLAAQWFARSAEQGYAKAQSRLATRYRTGEGVPQDLIEALKWASLAQTQGDEEAAELSLELRGLLSPQEIAEAENRAGNFRP
ncbi:tetratricopeptide repeat protein [Pelagibius sp. Alg239-R121]|uniref:tetratricopeptide repeat protein n=1 Tax=Pelagibius sp. Alg239-R121 TaxID=2993448 RepID=UPI0024A60D0F|nr:tetratricopeptide repeat protein [Pelagibius sp. Alg239-R121]